jgi:hypothetical protein
LCDFDELVMAKVNANIGFKAFGLDDNGLGHGRFFR